ncbi:MAG: ribonuclease HII [Pseudomonadota bacterium]
MKRPSLTIEQELRASGARRIAGVDEVGRGPLAGPVTAAAVVLDLDHIPDGIRDSKTLSPNRRETICAAILQSAEVAVAHASVEEIDEINILQATFLAMTRALNKLGEIPDFALVDGQRLPKDMPCPGRAVIKGDAVCMSIAAASIVAKVTRDRLMWDLAQQYPGYGWETNAGYGSKSHMAALQNLGPSPHHRRSFKPVHNILYQEKS